MIRLFLALALTGCASLKFENPGPAGTVTHEYVTSHFFWGALRHSSAPVPACPNGSFRDATMRQSAGDVLLTTVTLGIYVQHRTNVTCAP